MSDDPETTTYSRKTAVTFRRTSERFGGLSNMTPGFSLDVGGIHANSSEALYQTCRFPHLPDVQQMILNERSPMMAKMRSKPFRNDSRRDWDAVRVPIMKWCLKLKLSQHWRSFGDLLLETGDRLIVEDSPNDEFWGAKKADNADTLTGRNMLGRLLMELRQELRTTPETLEIIEPVPVSDFLLLGRSIPAIFADVHCRSISDSGETAITKVTKRIT